jgi:hypothetical protein
MDNSKDLRFDVEDPDMVLDFDDSDCDPYHDDPSDWDDYDDYDGQPDEYTEWQDLYGGDDWDHGQYDEGY